MFYNLGYEMNFVQKYFIKRRFVNYDLKIIKDINVEKAFQIAYQFHVEGWELSREYNDISDWPVSYGQAKLRKGQSTIEFEWQNDKANIIAPARILKGIASTYNLTIDDFPF